MARSFGYAQERPATIAVLGGINIDLVTIAARFPEAGETVVGSRFLTYPGGKGANQAVAAARLAPRGAEGLGADVKMIGRGGDDAFGGQLLDSLKSSGVNVSGVAVEPEGTTGIAVINIDAEGQNRIIQIPGANRSCGEAEVERLKAALVDASVLMLQIEVPLEVSLEAAREAAAAEKVIILDPAPARPLPQEVYRYCTFITPNETEAQALVGFPVADEASARRAGDELLDRGVGCAIIKMGAQGAYYITRGGIGQHLPAYPVRPVDTVAAGDAFNGALAVALAEGRGVEEAMGWAMAAGALAVTRTGAQDSMPRREEVEELLSSGLAQDGSPQQPR